LASPKSVNEKFRFPSLRFRRCKTPTAEKNKAREVGTSRAFLIHGFATAVNYLCKELSELSAFAFFNFIFIFPKLRSQPIKQVVAIISKSAERNSGAEL